MRPQVAIADLVEAAAARFGVSPAALTGRGRGQALVLPRWVVMALAGEMTGASSVAIGRALGRDHSTVLHGRRALGRLLLEGAQTPDGTPLHVAMSAVALLALEQAAVRGRAVARARAGLEAARLRATVESQLDAVIRARLAKIGEAT